MSKIKYEAVDFIDKAHDTMLPITNARIVDAMVSSDAHTLYDKMSITIEADVCGLAPSNTVLFVFTRRLEDFINSGSFTHNMSLLDIRKVIYHGPATIVYWGDGSRTVVKTQNGEPFDPEKGFAMACLKHLFDNKGNYNEFVKKWTNEENIKD